MVNQKKEKTEYLKSQKKKNVYIQSHILQFGVGNDHIEFNPFLPSFEGKQIAQNIYYLEIFDAVS